MFNPMVTLNWMVKNNPEILVDNMDLPDGMNKDAMEMYILQYAGENEVRYTDSVILQKFVAIWFRANKKQFSRIWETINAEYNPIENYDRHEVSERNTTGNETIESSGKQSSSVNSSSEADGTDSGQESGTNNVDKFVSAFDSTSLQPRESQEGEDSRNTSGTTHSESTNESTGEQTTESNGKTDRTGNEMYTNYTHGNIGTTSSQDMIKQERDIADFDIYYYIAMKFEDEFTIPVYGRSCMLNGILR